MMYGWIMMMAQCTSRMLLSLLNLFYSTCKTGIDIHQSTCFCHEMVRKKSSLLMKKHINNQATHQSILCPTPLLVSCLLFSFSFSPSPLLFLLCFHLLLLPIGVSSSISSSSPHWVFCFASPEGFVNCYAPVEFFIVSRQQYACNFNEAVQQHV